MGRIFLKPASAQKCTGSVDYSMGTLTASGDLGDFVVSLSMAKQLGMRHVNIVNHHSLRSIFTERAHLVAQLTEAQPYIEKVTVAGRKEDPQVDVTGMRRFHQRDRTLLEMQRKEVMMQTEQWMPYNSDPWLTASPHSYSPGRIIIARSERYRNERFPWKAIRDHFNDRLLFVGLPNEHKDFEKRFGWVEFYRSKDLYEVAQLIQGSDMFIGNQSSPNAVAQGLGKTSVLEVSDFVADCIYKRDNVTYFTNKPIVIEGHEFHPLTTQATPSMRMLWMRAFANAGIITP